MRRIALCLFALAVSGVGVGCSGDSGTPLTADEFAKQGNAICKAADAKLSDQGKDILKNTNTTPDQLAKFYLDHAVPNARTKLSGLSKLHPPTKDKDKVKKMLTAGRDATDLVEKGLKKQGAAYLQAKGPDQFQEFNSQAKALKLTDCAGTD